MGITTIINKGPQHTQNYNFEDGADSSAEDPTESNCHDRKDLEKNEEKSTVHVEEKTLATEREL